MLNSAVMCFTMDADGVFAFESVSQPKFSRICFGHICFPQICLKIPLLKNVHELLSFPFNLTLSISSHPLTFSLVFLLNSLITCQTFFFFSFLAPGPPLRSIFTSIIKVMLPLLFSPSPPLSLSTGNKSYSPLACTASHYSRHVTLRAPITSCSCRSRPGVTIPIHIKRLIT